MRVFLFELMENSPSVQSWSHWTSLLGFVVMIEHIKERSHGSGFAVSVGQIDLYRFNDNRCSKTCNNTENPKSKRTSNIMWSTVWTIFICWCDNCFTTCAVVLIEHGFTPLFLSFLVFIVHHPASQNVRFIYLMWVFVETQAPFTWSDVSNGLHWKINQLI